MEINKPGPDELKEHDIKSLLLELWQLIILNLPKTLSMRTEVNWKPDGSPVTNADIWHEKLISKFLMNKLPGIQIIAEESYTKDIKLKKGWIAIVDPIDSTENFASGLKEWGVAISIWKEDKHIASSLYLPELNEYIISGQKLLKYSSRIIGLSSSYNQEIGKIIQENTESRIMGCCVYNTFNVIKGSYKQFINPKGAYCWDLQASIMLALEHSCIVKVNGNEYDGKLLEPNKRHCISIFNK